MHLYEGNRDVEIYNSLQILRIKSESGKGVQSLISEMQGKGYVAKKFEEIIKKANSGIELDKAIFEVQKHEKNKYLNNLLNSFRISIEQNINLKAAIDQIEEQILEEHKENIDKFVSHTNFISGIALYTSFLPFLYIVIEILNWTYGEFIGNPSGFLTDNLRILIFGGSLVVFLIATLITRYER